MDDSVKKNTIHSIALGDGEKIRSLELVVDMASCVAQLAENCLDSGASAIEVKVDCSRLSCSVADNGRGLTLAEIGCIGNIRYSSSKDAAHGTYGFRGEALHSISLLALLELESRAAGASVTATKICSGGVTLSTTFGPPRSSNGTTVTVRDLFRDWPIRRKSLKPKLQLSRIKANLMRLSLLNYTTSWSLVDTEKGKVIWSVRGASSLLGRINEVRGPINPAFTFVSHQKAPYRVEGALALIPRSPTKPCAELFINKRPLPSSHELISLLTATRPENSTTANAQGRESSASSRKNLLVPAFVLHIECDPDLCDVLLEPEKSSVMVQDPDVVSQMLLELIQGATRSGDNVLLPTLSVKLPSAKVQPQPSDDSFFDDQPQQRSTLLPDAYTYRPEVAPVVMIPYDLGHQATTESLPQSDERLIADPPTPVATVFEDFFFGGLRSPTLHTDSQNARPVVGLTVHRTRASREATTQNLKRPRVSFGSAFFDSETHDNPFLLQQTEEKHISEEGETLDEEVNVDELEIVKDDIKENSQDILPSCDSTKPPELNQPKTLPGVALPHTSNSWDEGGNIDSGRYRAPSETRETAVLSIEWTNGRSVQQSNPVRLTKETLQNAEVIAQADLKFVLARAGDMLIAVDQHAADERVQLERLEREIYDGATNGIHAQTSPTSPTVVLALSDNEMSLLDLHSRSVESFGFSFLYPRESASNGPESSVVVTGVPVVLGVTLAVEDMRVLLHQLGEFDPAASLFQVKPPVFQYILCSKACRGAVMFGDALTHLDCTSLITSLAKCELPFQCAHGRPSSIIVVKDLRRLAKNNEIPGRLTTPPHPSRWNGRGQAKKLKLSSLKALPSLAGNGH